MMLCMAITKATGIPNIPSVAQMKPPVRKLINVSKMANGKNRLSWIGSNTVDDPVPLTTPVPTLSTNVPEALVLLVMPSPAMSDGIDVVTSSELNGDNRLVLGSTESNTKIPALTQRIKM